ncbi:nuclear transport factor 2 family protein [Maribius pontilimi]|uniref:Nuclear transport factor 2 family protein n=1 Tax=Palleronia pontilimi TaxID=1964209 RepID=A0A934IJ76_9RHOB|nr:nuclear transport factor 2 family protein [Palleronia pontilimi]MBJ3763550.1 nuclear transport factor 2 family protein [Palleronia pontilimi]
MSLMDIANELVDRVRNGDGTQLLETIYAKDAESVEASSPEGEDRVSKGLDALRGKHAWWDEHMETHSMGVEGPFPHGDDKFAVIYDVDATNKQTKDRMKMREVAVYTVRNDKIAREEFFYTSGG